MDSALTTIITVLIVAVPVILAITLHEASHGYAALVFGDPTAKEQGRLTLNPIRHVDIFGTILLPLILFLAHAPIFGWAKPVPVNFGRLRHPKQNMVWVAAAGPAANLVLVVLSTLILLALPQGGTWSQALEIGLQQSIFVNLTLAIFNMFPLPPLDGGRVAVGLLPLPLARALARTEKYGMFILLLVLVVLPTVGSYMGVDLNIFGWIVLPIVDAAVKLIAAVTGLNLS